MKEIVQDGPPNGETGAGVLHEIAKPVPEEVFGSAELSKLIAEMSEALDKEPEGVALAAPQVDVSWRLFIVRKDRTLPPEIKDVENVPSERAAEVEVYINPEIIKTSRKRAYADEGCLSLHGLYGTTHRHERVTIRARRPDGSRFQRGGGGIMAQIFEHEIDHLNGILFIECAENLVRITHEPEK